MAAYSTHHAANTVFGYDPLFLPDEQLLSAAELDPSVKNRLSHRGQALAQLHARIAAAHS